MPKIVNKQVADLSPYEIQSLRMRDKLKGLSPSDKLKAWYASEEPFDLNEMETRLKERWEFARVHFMDCKMYSEIVEELVDEFGISPQLAKIDIRNMRHTFGDTDEISKQAHRQRAQQMALKAYKMAENDKDAATMIKASKQYLIATGADSPDSDQLDVQKLMEDRTYVEVLDPGIRELLMGIIANFNGVVDSSKVFEMIMSQKQVVDIPHEMVA